MLTRRFVFRGNARKTIQKLKTALQRFREGNDRANAFNATHDNQQPNFYKPADNTIPPHLVALEAKCAELLAARELR